jgi:hypothetical protein
MENIILEPLQFKDFKGKRCAGTERNQKTWVDGF